MLLLISVNRKGERVQDEFASQDDLSEHLKNLRFRKWITVDKRDEPQDELKDLLMEACRQIPFYVDPSTLASSFVYEPHKEGKYLIGHCAEGDVEVFGIFFVCETEQK